MDLEDYRREIDRVDREIVDAVERRLNVAEEIGALKQEKDMEVEDSGREEKVKQRYEKLFRDRGLPEEEALELAEILISAAKEVQRD